MSLPKRTPILPMQSGGSRAMKMHGNAKKITELRQMLLEVATQEEVRQIYQVLLAMAKGGSLAAIKEILDRLFGKANVGLFNTLVDDEMASIVDLQSMPAEDLQAVKRVQEMLARQQQMIVDQRSAEGEID